MGKIEIDIPKSLEARLLETFPGEDVAAVLLRLARERLAEPEDAAAKEAGRKLRFADALRALDQFRASGRGYTDDEIWAARQVGRP